jgi:hypothetical protein
MPEHAIREKGHIGHRINVLGICYERRFVAPAATKRLISIRMIEVPMSVNQPIRSLGKHRWNASLDLIDARPVPSIDHCAAILSLRPPSHFRHHHGRQRSPVEFSLWREECSDLQSATWQPVRRAERVARQMAKTGRSFPVGEYVSKSSFPVIIYFLPCIQFICRYLGLIAFSDSM